MAYELLLVVANFGQQFLVFLGQFINIEGLILLKLPQFWRLSFLAECLVTDLTSLALLLKFSYLSREAVVLRDLDLDVALIFAERCLDVTDVYLEPFYRSLGLRVHPLVDFTVAACDVAFQLGFPVFKFLLT